jgi:small subunit ribosomal protein S4e
MGHTHLKPNHAPAPWRIERKTRPWVLRPRPGGTPLAHTLSLGVLLRDLLRIGDSLREIRYALANNEILINGVATRDPKRPVGFLDVVSIPSTKTYVRLTLDERGGLVIEKLSAQDGVAKLTRIKDKTWGPKGIVRITCFDGRTLLLDPKAAAPLKPGSSLLLGMPKGEIKAHLPLAVGSSVLLFGGKHVGKTGTVSAIEHGLIEVKTTHGVLHTKAAYALATP